MTKQGSQPGNTTADTGRRAAFSGIEQHVLMRLRALNLGPKPPMVVGFSGGADSLCLAAILARLSRSGRVKPLLVHVNHHLRPESDRDAEQAAVLAEELALPISIRSIDGDLGEKHPGVGMEEAARRERYLLLAGAAGDFGTRTIAIAHHQDDQVETVLLHLFRGAGLKGVSGMAAVTTSEIPWWTPERIFPTDFDLWRPLLLEPKSMIDSFVSDSGLSPVVDESNSDPSFRRNAIRHTILPVIDSVYPAARMAIANFARIVHDEDELLDELAYESLVQAGLIDGRLTRTLLLLVPGPIQRRIVVIWLQQWLSSEAISLDRVDAVIELAIQNRGRKLIEVGENVRVELIGDELKAVGVRPDPQV